MFFMKGTVHTTMRRFWSSDTSKDTTQSDTTKDTSSREKFLRSLGTSSVKASSNSDTNIKDTISDKASSDDEAISDPDTDANIKDKIIRYAQSIEKDDTRKELVDCAERLSRLEDDATRQDAKGHLNAVNNRFLRKRWIDLNTRIDNLHSQQGQTLDNRWDYAVGHLRKYKDQVRVTLENLGIMPETN